MRCVGPLHRSSSTVPRGRMKVVPGVALNLNVFPRVSSSYLTDPSSTTCRKFSTCSCRGMSPAGTEWSSKAIPDQCTGTLDSLGSARRRGSTRPSRRTSTPESRSGLSAGDFAAPGGDRESSVICTTMSSLRRPAPRSRAGDATPTIRTRHQQQAKTGLYRQPPRSLPIAKTSAQP